MGTPSAKNLMLGAGQIFFDRLDKNGNRTGLRHLGNVPKFELNTEVEKIEKKSSMSAARETYDEAIKDIKAKATLTIEEFDPANMALGLLGEAGIITQTPEAVVDARFRAYKGKYINLNAFNISNVVVRPITAKAANIGPATAVGAVTSTGTVTASGNYSGTAIEDYYVVISTANTAAGAIAGTKFQWKKGLSGVLSTEILAGASAAALENGVQVLLALTGTQNFVVGDTWKISVSPALSEYTAGIDFKTDAVLLRGGMVLIPEASRIEDGVEVLVSFSKSAGAFPSIAGATTSNIRGYLLFLGDPSKGPAYNAEFWKVSLTPNGAIPFIGDDYAGFELTMTALSDRENHPDEPLYRAIQLG